MLNTIESKVRKNRGWKKIMFKWVAHSSRRSIFQLETFCRLRREHIGLVGRFNEQESRLRWWRRQRRLATTSFSHELVRRIAAIISMQCRECYIQHNSNKRMVLRVTIFVTYAKRGLHRFGTWMKSWMARRHDCSLFAFFHPLYVLLLLFYGQLVFILHLFSCSALHLQHHWRSVRPGYSIFYLHITLDTATLAASVLQCIFLFFFFLGTIKIFQLREWIWIYEG